MVSILPIVDPLGNTAVDWFCILSYFRLDTLPIARAKAPNNIQYSHLQYQLYPCMNFTCSGRITKLLFVANRTGNELNQLPRFHLLRKYHGPEYCPVGSRSINATDNNIPCTYYQWLTLNFSVQYPRLIYTNGTFGVYEMPLSTNNSFKSNDILGVSYPGIPTTQREILYQREGVNCDTLGEITLHLSGGGVNFTYPHEDPVLPYIAIETGQQIH